MGLRFILSHRPTLLVAACCAVICTIGCGRDEPDVTATAPEAVVDTTDTQYVSSSQSSGGIDFDDLSGSLAESPAQVDGESARDNVSSPSISASLTVVAERTGIEKV